jgi:SWI/SNF-related matrix-associated actin-dependent regulator 1 of chromatin subfamily A
MKVSYNSTKNRAEAHDAYDLRGDLKSAGWRWDPAGRVWWTDSPERLTQFAASADESARAWAADQIRLAATSLDSSRAVSSDISVPVPEGMDYLPFQRAGIAYALARPATLIGDEMGLGKTIQAIGLINARPDIRTVLIICPASLKLNWKRELEKWLVVKRSIGIAAGKAWPGACDIVICNFDIIANFLPIIHGRQWDLLVVDESHFLKNPKTKRTKLVLGAKTKTAPIPAIQATRRLFLTGTPICNRPVELWPLVHALDPNDIGRNWVGFVRRYCNGHQTRFGWDVSGASNLTELQERLRSKIMVRRMKSDVLTELPPKRRQVIELPCNGAKPYVEAELAAWESKEALLADLKNQAEALKDGDPAEYKAAVDALKSAVSVAFSEMAKARHDTAVAKVPSLIAFLHDLIDDDPDAKIVFFAHHHDVIDSVMAEFSGVAVKFTGETNMDDRQLAVDTFQTNPKCQLFVASITAAGVGITLTASSHVIFGELDWVPGNVSQAEDRCHRIGQHDSVLVQHVVLDGSLDALMARRLIEKQQVIDAALNNNNGGTI